MTAAPPPSAPALLFTAFEPSGDQLAAPVIARLRALRPDLVIHALGGEHMKAAGADLVETTGHNADMLLGAVGLAMEHKRRLKRVRAWLMQHPISALIPVDSPAANWSICKLVRRLQPRAKVLHLVAPQVWAWGAWRIHKLRRLTDHVLCILPFEPDWLANRDIPATYVGHPLYSALSATIADPPGIELPEGSPRLALLPGSRGSEHRKNWGMMLQVFHRLAARHPGLAGVVAAVDPAAARRLAAIKPLPPGATSAALRQREGEHGEPPGWPVALHMRTGAVDDVFRWCDAVLVVSGTATLHAAVFEKPMAVVYNARKPVWQLAGRFVIKTRTFALPNLIAESQGRPRIVPEFVPHFGDPAPVAAVMDRLLSDPAARQEQRRGLRWIGDHFRHVAFADRAAEQIVKMALAGGQSRVG